MAFTNEQVAERFVRGLPGKGSNTTSAPGQPPGSWRFLSYSTIVANIRDGNLYLHTDRFSNSTARQMSYIKAHWALEHPGEEGHSRVYTLADPIGGNSYGNRKYYMERARVRLYRLQHPVDMRTRSKNWNAFNFYMAQLDRVLALPYYSGVQQITGREQEAMDRLNAVRNGTDVANPVGLKEFDNDLLLRVKAICALEGVSHDRI